MATKKAEVAGIARPQIPNAQLSDFAVTAKTTKSEHHTLNYSNSVQLGMSPWDIRIMFGQVVEGGVGTASVEMDATIIMSPAHAKATAAMLNSTIKQYEALFGEIHNPLEAINAAGAAAKLAENASLSKKGIKK